MRSIKEINILEEEVKKIFLRCNLKPPRRILPNIIFDWMTPEYCFKVRMRNLLSEIKMRKNFYGTNQEGSLEMHKGQLTPIIIQYNKGFKKALDIKKQIKKIVNININKI